MLMRPEYRNQIDAKYKKKIEQIVRKTGNKTEEEEEGTSPCPHCEFDLHESELTCPSCRNTIPYCIATGRHIVRQNLTVCPSCDFTAIYSEFQKFLDIDPVCPMCSAKVSSDELIRVKNVEKYLTKS